MPNKPSKKLTQYERDEIIRHFELEYSVNRFSTRILETFSNIELSLLDKEAALADELAEILLLNDDDLLDRMLERGTVKTERPAKTPYGAWAAMPILRFDRSPIPKRFEGQNIDRKVSVYSLFDFRDCAREILIKRLRVKFWRQIISLNGAGEDDSLEDGGFGNYA